MKKKESIIHSLTSTIGAGESTEVYQYTDLSTGETELVIEKTIRERYPVTEYEKVMNLHERLNRGGGRRVYSLEDLTK